MNRFESFFIGGSKFKNEFRKQMRLLIIVTIGFTIAFSWRQTIFDAVQTAVSSVFGTQGFASSILTSVAITLFGLFLIYLTSHLLKQRPDNY